MMLGAHGQIASMAAASLWSFSVTTFPASWVVSSIVTVLYTLLQLGWWLCFSAKNATLVMNEKASWKSLKRKVFLSRLSSSVHMVWRGLVKVK